MLNGSINVAVMLDSLNICSWIDNVTDERIIRTLIAVLNERIAMIPPDTQNQKSSSILNLSVPLGKTSVSITKEHIIAWIDKQNDAATLQLLRKYCEAQLDELRGE